MKALKFIFNFFFHITIFISLSAVIGFCGAFLYLTPNLPSITNLKNIQYQVPLRIYTQDHKLIAEYGEKRRIPIKYAALPKALINGFISAEDDRFFYHPGVDYKGILRAVVTLARTGQRRQGGSTITMQVARNFFLSRKKTYLRKLNEIFLSLKIERALSKQDILQLYLNKIFLGHRAYGVAAAADAYYGQPLDNLTMAQYAMIAGLPKAPSTYNPITNPTRALQRRNYVLKRMHKLGHLADDAYAIAKKAPITAKYHGRSIESSAPYLSEMVRAAMIEKYGDDAMTSGYQVYTTLDSKLQKAAQFALRKALMDYDTRHGYKGPEAHFEINPDTDLSTDWDEKLKHIPTTGGLIPGLVTDVKEKTVSVYLGENNTITLPWAGLSWAKRFIKYNRFGHLPKKATDILSIGDLIRVSQTPKKQTFTEAASPEESITWRLSQVPKVSGAFVSLNPKNGAILALQGGFDFYYSKFNRASQAKRQPGSGFKPFVYTAALDKGYTPATLINDAPIVLNDVGAENVWRPQNYGKKTYGPTRLRKGLRLSRNLISIRLLRDIGIPYARNYVTRFGFPKARLPNNLSLVLGTGTFSPLEMATAYTALANGGYHVEAFFIEHIKSGQNETIFTHKPITVCPACDQPEIAQALTEQGLTPAPRVISAQTHYLINSLLQDVIQRGTGIKAKRALKRQDIAGKTGTTNDQKDAWFYGYNQDYVGVAWVGFDNVTPLGSGETGGTAALPVWVEYMKVALKDKAQKQFPIPSGIVTVRIDTESGLRTTAKNPNAMYEIFRTSNIPKQTEERPLSNGKDPYNSDEELF